MVHLIIFSIELFQKNSDTMPSQVYVSSSWHYLCFVWPENKQVFAELQTWRLSPLLIIYCTSLSTFVFWLQGLCRVWHRSCTQKKQNFNFHGLKDHPVTISPIFYNNYISGVFFLVLLVVLTVINCTYVRILFCQVKVRL